MPRRLQIAAAVMLVCFSLLCFAQERQSRSLGDSANLQRVFGTVESIAPDKLVVKDADGKTTTVKLTSATRFRKDRQDATIADLKAGDRVMAAGKPESDGTVVAQFVVTGLMRGGQGGPSRMGGAPPSPEEMVRMGLGTRFIAGEVKNIEETKLTLLRPDGQTQVIEADENTSFRNGNNESITLADIKPGDHVAGRGEMKNGIFVPQVLRVGVHFLQRAPENKQ